MQFAVPYDEIQMNTDQACERGGQFGLAVLEPTDGLFYHLVRALAGMMLYKLDVNATPSILALGLVVKSLVP